MPTFSRIPFPTYRLTLFGLRDARKSTPLNPVNIAHTTGRNPLALPLETRRARVRAHQPHLPALLIDCCPRATAQPPLCPALRRAPFICWDQPAGHAFAQTYHPVTASSCSCAPIVAPTRAHCPGPTHTHPHAAPRRSPASQ